MKNLFLFIFVFSSVGLVAKAENPLDFGNTFYSFEGREREVSFQSVYLANALSLDQIKKMDDTKKFRFKHDQIEPSLQFLFGPLTRRGLGSPQRGLELNVDWAAAKIMEGGRVAIPYEYRAVWIVDKDVREPIVIPVPLNSQDLNTNQWRHCTDSDPAHQTQSFYWYFWDPERVGCDHKKGVHYENVVVHLERETRNETQSFPEYQKLLRSTGAENRFQLTFGFGYVEDPINPQPDFDRDSGMVEYRAFISQIENSLGFRESKIYPREYRSEDSSTRVIGRRFEGKIRGTDVVINVVAAAGIDQMEIFAKSFAHDHDGFFGWFGHSRVGSGFDAERFWQMVVRNPSYYSVTQNYQIIYWGGCNSYSYYTLPFFEFKEHVANGLDPHGTKGLDIIANGLPSFFTLNADNASIVLKHLLNWDKKPSYQTIVNELEARAKSMGVDVLVTVLGDEDNQ